MLKPWALYAPWECLPALSHSLNTKVTLRDLSRGKPPCYPSNTVPLGWRRAAVKYFFKAILTSLYPVDRSILKPEFQAWRTPLGLLITGALPAVIVGDVLNCLIGVLNMKQGFEASVVFSSRPQLVKVIRRSVTVQVRRRVGFNEPSWTNALANV